MAGRRDGWAAETAPGGPRPCSGSPPADFGRELPGDREWFIGGEELTARLAGMVASTGSPGDADVPLAVVGPWGRASRRCCAPG